MPDIVPLAQIAPAAIETLLDAAFGTDRHARTAYTLRAGVDWLPALSFAAVDGGRLLGTVQCWPVRIVPPAGTDAGPVPLTLLGPVAVDPARQQGGLGKRLTRAAIHAAAAAGAPPLMLIGDPGYYGRFGFTAAPTAGWMLPGPFERHRLLVLPQTGHPLPPGGMIGPAPTAVRPAGFASAAQMA